MKYNSTFIAWRLLSFFLALSFSSFSFGSDSTKDLKPVDFVVTGQKIEDAQKRADYYNIGRYIGQLKYMAYLAQQSNSNLQESSSDLSSEGGTSQDEKVSCHAVELRKAHCDQVAYSAYAEWVKTCRSYVFINADAQCRAEKKANLDADLKSCIFVHRFNSVNCVE